MEEQPDLLRCSYKFEVKKFECGSIVQFHINAIVRKGVNLNPNPELTFFGCLFAPISIWCNFIYLMRAMQQHFSPFSLSSALPSSSVHSVLIDQLPKLLQLLC